MGNCATRPWRPTRGGDDCCGGGGGGGGGTTKVMVAPARPSPLPPTRLPLSPLDSSLAFRGRVFQRETRPRV